VDRELFTKNRKMGLFLATNKSPLLSEVAVHDTHTSVSQQPYHAVEPQFNLPFERFELKNRWDSTSKNFELKVLKNRNYIAETVVAHMQQSVPDSSDMEQQECEIQLQIR
jgi:hypothetical protein